jgi:acyl carrier protein
MTEQAINAEFQAVIRRLFKHPDLVLRREMRAFDIKGWDSLSHINLMIALEKTFGIKFKPREVVNLQNVGELSDLIEAKRARK